MTNSKYLSVFEVYVLSAVGLTILSFIYKAISCWNVINFLYCQNIDICNKCLEFAIAFSNMVILHYCFYIAIQLFYVFLFHVHAGDETAM